MFTSKTVVLEALTECLKKLEKADYSTVQEENKLNDDILHHLKDALRDVELQEELTNTCSCGSGRNYGECCW